MPGHPPCALSSLIIAATTLIMAYCFSLSRLTRFRPFACFRSRGLLARPARFFLSLLCAVFKVREFSLFSPQVRLEPTGILAIPQNDTVCKLSHDTYLRLAQPRQASLSPLRFRSSQLKLSAPALTCLTRSCDIDLELKALPSGLQVLSPFTSGRSHSP